MPAILNWLHNQKLRWQNFYEERLSKRQGGLRWYKAELLAARSDYARLEGRLDGTIKVHRTRK